KAVRQTARSAFFADCAYCAPGVPARPCEPYSTLPSLVVIVATPMLDDAGFFALMPLTVTTSPGLMVSRRQPCRKSALGGPPSTRYTTSLPSGSFVSTLV